MLYWHLLTLDNSKDIKTMIMKLFKISQDVHTGHDIYVEAIVAAGNEEKAKMTHPSGCNKDWDYEDTWCSIEDVKVELIGDAIPGTPPGVIVSDFNAR